MRLYFPCAHVQPVFIERHVDLPVTEDLRRRMLSRPFNARLTQAEFDEIATSLEAAVAGGAFGSSAGKMLAAMAAHRALSMRTTLDACLPVTGLAAGGVMSP